MAAQPALQGARAGQVEVGVAVVELDAQEAGSPQGVCLAEGQDQGESGMVLTGASRAGPVVAGQVVGLAAEALQEVADGARAQAQAIRQFGRGQALVGEGQEALADGEGDGVWHGSPRSTVTGYAEDTASPGAAKPLCPN